DEALTLGMLGGQRRGEHEVDVALAENIARLVAQPRLQAGVGNDIKAEGVAIEVRRLPGITDEEANVVDAPQRQRVIGCHAHSTSRRGHHGTHGTKTEKEIKGEQREKGSEIVKLLGTRSLFLLTLSLLFFFLFVFFSVCSVYSVVALFHVYTRLRRSCSRPSQKT